MVVCKGIKTYKDLLDAWKVLMKHSANDLTPWSEDKFNRFMGNSKNPGQLTIGLENEHSTVRFNYSLNLLSDPYIEWKNSFMEKHNKNLQ